MTEARVNGVPRRLPPDGRRLLDWLRRDLGLLVRSACDRGQCGACTVLIDGVPRLACCTVAATLVDTEVLTIAGVGDDHPVQAALCRTGGVQCGFCTPGMVMALVAATRSVPDGDLGPHVRRAIGGNVCRCTGYVQIVEAGIEACQASRHEGDAP